MSSRDQRTGKPTQWDLRLGRYLKNWVGRYSTPAGGRQRLLLAATLMSTPQVGTPERIWYYLISQLRRLSPRALFFDPWSDDLLAQSWILSVRFHPAWAASNR